jgi:alkylhydroperoxidase/carboxymuconolactone decarboxylase family protein YurZ
MRIFAASRAERHHEVIQSARGYINAVEFLLAGVEDGYISATGAELDLKIRQLNAIAALVNQASAEVNAAGRDEMQARLEELSQRLTQKNARQ